MIMGRKYGDEQKEVIKGIKNQLKIKLERVYLETFEKLDSHGLGDGAIAKLTQQLLISRESALSNLKDLR